MSGLCKKERVICRKKAPGSCPYCHGEVTATVVECTRKVFGLTLSVTSKLKYFCSNCSKRLVAYSDVA